MAGYRQHVIVIGIIHASADAQRRLRACRVAQGSPASVRTDGFGAVAALTDAFPVIVEILSGEKLTGKKQLVAQWQRQFEHA
ncbi:hypothetical protein [Chlorobaculum tepidum]|uniref:hypothetical protein n=1 Tax=Chlorobaculum tepidum TaxID=1097 RepID=UPI0013E8A5C2|nr:hypothetical protein [Chlorobaculum tepidum]